MRIKHQLSLSPSDLQPKDKTPSVSNLCPLWFQMATVVARPAAESQNPTWTLWVRLPR